MILVISLLFDSEAGHRASETTRVARLSRTAERFHSIYGLFVSRSVLSPPPSRRTFNSINGPAVHRLPIMWRAERVVGGRLWSVCQPPMYLRGSLSSRVDLSSTAMDKLHAICQPVFLRERERERRDLTRARAPPCVR